MSDILQAKTITGEYSGFADSALRDVSSTFLTAHQDLSDYQTTAGMTAYQPVGDYLTTADSGNFAQKSDFFWEIREEDDPLLISVSGNYIHALSADHAYTTETAINCRSAQTARRAIYDGNGAEISTHYYTTANISGFLTQDSLSNDFVAYSASAVELPNAKFKVDNSGQAFKIVETEGQLITITGTKKEGTSISQFNKELLNRAVYSSNATGGTWEAGWFNTDISDSYNIPTNGIIDLTRIPEDIWNSSTTLEIDPYNYELIVLSSREKIYTDVEYLTAVPAGTMNESAFSYDASDNITAYNGSAFKAGDEFPQSATEAIETVTSSSAIWNETTDTVSSNSGAWGGSALPISAGPGIKFEMVDNTLVASIQGPILDEITTAGTWNGREVKQMLQSGTFETNINTDVIPINSAYSAASSKWIDPSNSYIQYGSTANILPSTWVLGATGRLGSLSLLNGIVRVRSNDTTNTQCTAFVTIKWCEN